MNLYEICYKKIFTKNVGLFVLIMLFSQNLLHAQKTEFSVNPTLNKSISTQKNGMLVLGSWAVLNIISGTMGFYNSNNSDKYFYQMNAAWNLVNLGIAGFGYRGALNIDPNLNYSMAINKMQSFERVLLINAGLDILYIGTGALLWKRGITKSSDRQIGYGKSIILQGSFLLLFDSALYLIHNKNTQNLLQITDQLSFTGNSILLSF